MGVKLLGYFLCATSFCLCSGSDFFYPLDLKYEGRNVPSSRQNSTILHSKSGSQLIEVSDKDNNPSDEDCEIQCIPDKEQCKKGSDGGHYCGCKVGFGIDYSEINKGCVTCKLDTDCLGSDKECWIKDDSPKCGCRKGFEFSQDGKTCKECSCGVAEAGTCTLKEDDLPQCQCKEGYQKSNKGEKCIECSCGVAEAGTCTLNEDDLPQCQCKEGYQKSNKGEKCIECSCGVARAGTCTLNEDDLPQCQCKEGYQKSSKGEKCIECICGVARAGTCTLNEDDLPQCECKEGYLKSNKGEKCIECSCGVAGAGTCTLNEDDLPQCECKEGYLKSNKGEKCIECNCGDKGAGNCTLNQEDKPKCTCAEGYETSTNEEKCIVTFCKSKPCMNDGECILNDTRNGFKCICKEDRPYTGETCNQAIKCDTDPCKNGGTCIDNEGKDAFRCECAPQWEGYTCETAKLCTGNPCKNGGDCSDADGKGPFECKCPLNWTGYTCDKPVTCKSDPPTCNNGGTCTDNNGQGPFNCVCPTEWTGETCEKEHPCNGNPCENGGTCQEIKEAHDYKCVCPVGYIGKKCDKVDPCMDSEICQNGGTCTVTADENDYKCSCTELWVGKNCTRESPCRENPCVNGACRPNDDESSYICDCTRGWGGTNCTVECDCGDHGNCSVTADEKKTCDCQKNYISHEGKCIKDQCAENPCKHEGKCSLTEDKKDFTCTCNYPWTGKTCNTTSICVELDESVCPGKCVSDNTTHIGYCPCDKNEEYFDYEKKKCEKIDLCPLRQCKENEICKEGECGCKPHFKEEGEGDNKACVSDLCSTNPCAHESMNCTNTKDHYICRCNDGEYFTGTECKSDFCHPGVTTCKQKCNENKEECECYEGFEMKESACGVKNGTELCDLSCQPGRCVKIAGEPKCFCPWSPDRTNSCKSACDGEGNTDASVCPTKKCKQDGDKFSCICTGRYKPDPEKQATCLRRERCEADDTEALSACKDKNAVCVPDDSKEDGYDCKCPSGHDWVVTEKEVEGKEQKEVKKVCTELCQIKENKDKCYFQNKICYVEKVNSEYKPVCKCHSPLFLTESARSSCELARYLQSVTLPVRKRLYVKKNSASYSHVTSRAAEGIDTDKLEEDIKAAMKLLLPGEPGKEYSLEISPKESSGETISTNLVIASKADMKQYIGLIKAPTTCITENENSAECVLGSGLVLNAAEINSITPKDEDPCDDVTICGPHSTCSKTGEDNFECVCNDGYIEYDHRGDPRFLFRYCKEPDVCAESNPCGDTSICVNNRGSYYCKCKPDHKFKDDSKKEEDNKEPCIGLCEDNPCKRGKCEKGGDFSFFCRCEKGVAGRICDTEDMYLKKASSNVVVVGAVLGCILALTFIVFYVTVRKLKKRKHDYLEDNTAAALRGDAAEMVERPERQQFRQGQGVSNRGYMRD